ncbi:MAG: lysostaphin resistance A-like protein [Thermoplasmatota archaeon]
MDEMESENYEEAVVEEFDDDKWHGVPPAGKKPILGKGMFLLWIVIFLLIEFTLWGTYRYLTKDIYGPGFNIPFFIGHIIAAPTIALIPILVWWTVVRKEKLFQKDDLENGKFMSFNIGPFKLTKKRLFTAVLVGLFGGVMWRVSEMIIYNFFSSVLGGQQFMTPNVVDVFTLEGMGWPTFFLMTFVMFFIVGPVEEFQFRSFAHDQSQRILPKWAALVFSSVFFGLSHMPIALFIYTQPPYNATATDIFFMQIGWMAAGATFGALYMWSRNIFACIVMHGIGNWQLSVFWISNKFTAEGLVGTNAYLADLAVSIFANALMIIAFFLVHKYYWEPQRRGEAAFGGRWMGLQRFSFSLDNGSKTSLIPAGALSAVTVVTLVVLFGLTSAVGLKSLDKLYPSEERTGPSGDFVLEEFTQTSDTVLMDGDMDVGDTETVALNSTSWKIIKEVEFLLSWQDEAEKPGRPTIRPYTNNPDTFRLTITAPNITATDQAVNTEGGSGSVRIIVKVNDSAIMETFGKYDVVATIEMVEAGGWFSPLAILGWNDPGNTYDLQMNVKYLENSALEPETPVNNSVSEEPEVNSLGPQFNIYREYWDIRYGGGSIWPMMT